MKRFYLLAVAVAFCASCKSESRPVPVRVDDVFFRDAHGRCVELRVNVPVACKYGCTAYVHGVLAPGKCEQR